jgi:hypothetical protein
MARKITMIGGGAMMLAMGLTLAAIGENPGYALHAVFWASFGSFFIGTGVESLT